MRKRGKSLKLRREEQQVKSLQQAFERRGVVVRREKLSRGHSFRVKSGDCQLQGEPHVFLDRRLPMDQQIVVLVDYLLDFKFDLNTEELAPLSSGTRSLLSARTSAAAN